jgi:hypothetical protein
VIEQILLALVLTSVTVAIHVVGSVHVVMPWAANRIRVAAGPMPAGAVMLLVRLVSGLLLLHFVEMAVRAAAFHLAGVLADFETSMYFSLKSYTTVGHGDVLPTRDWRLLGPIEAAVGVPMLSISTSFIVAIVHRMHFERVETEKAAARGNSTDPSSSSPRY